MTTVKGYKLVCEFCGITSDSIWNIKDPEELKMVSKEYHEEYSRNYYSANDYEAFNKNVYLPKGWNSISLSKSSSEVTYSEVKVKPNFFKPAETYYRKTIFIDKNDCKYVYFCCQAHEDSYKRLKKTCEEKWNENYNCR